MAIVLSGSEGPTQVKVGDWMETSFSIAENGQLIAQTRTWSTNKLNGFTGGVFIVLLNESKGFVWYSEQHRYGVNGMWIPGGSTDRTVMWNDQVDVSVLPYVHSYAIVHQHTRTKRVFVWVKENSGEIIKIAKVIDKSG